MQRLSASLLSFCMCASLAAWPQARRAPQIVEPVNDGARITLKGNTHPLARAQFDRGRVSANLPMSDVMLVLKRTPEAQRAFDDFVQSQYDEKSPNYHHWLTPQQVGSNFGPSQTDIDAISNWLRSRGFSIADIPPDRMTVRFNGTARQVEQSFHTEIHHLDVNGEMHIANMTDPQIPAALSPVVAAVHSLHNFFLHTQHRIGNRVQWNPQSGRWEPFSGAASDMGAKGSRPDTADPQPNGITNEGLSPSDLATIYNVLPLWNQQIDGTGQTIYIAGRSNINPGDIANYQSTFGLPANPVTVVITNTDPGTSGDDDLGENTSDVEISDAAAPGAHIVLVASSSTQSDGAVLSAQYIVSQGPMLPTTPAIMSFSYGKCESAMASDGSNTLFNNMWESAAAEGIAVFVSTADSGSAACDNDVLTQPTDSSWTVATMGEAVSGTSSTPYNTAVGGTDFNWNMNPSTYWNTSNSSTTDANAKSYIPETPWNETCAGPIGMADLQIWAELLQTLQLNIPSPTTAEEACNFVVDWAPVLYQDFSYKDNDEPDNIFGFVGVSGGTGGKSTCVQTQTSGNTQTCSGGYSKPAWQANVNGIPDDGVRDLPDVSFFAGSGWASWSAYLICVSFSDQSACSQGTVSTFQQIGGTSLASPYMAGVMALINQKAGAPQGNPNAELYSLAAQNGYSGCSAETVTASSSCLFNDVDQGTIAMPCEPGSPQCTTTDQGDAIGVMDGYSAGAGYDLATGLGSLNVANVVNAWSAGLLTPSVTVTPAATSITTAQALSVSVSVSGGGGNPAATGSVTLTGGSYTSASATLTSGAATINIPAGSLSVGKDTLTATYTPDTAGSETYNSATGSAAIIVTATSATTPVVTVTPASSTIAAAQSLSVSVSVSASAGSPIPTGSVVLAGGGYTSAATPLTSGAATIVIAGSSLAPGNDTLTAAYTPDGSSASVYNSATGTAAVAVTQASAATFVLTNSGVISVAAGATSGNTSIIAITPSNGFTGQVNLTCSLTNSPSGAVALPTCTVVSPVTISASTAVTATLTVQTTAATSAAVTPGKTVFFAGGGSLLAVVLFFGIPARRRVWRMLLATITVIVFAGAVGCGGGSNAGNGGGGNGGGGGGGNSGTTAGNYIVTVTGTDAATGKVSSSVTVNVTVN